ncbi:MAG: accessory Sec system translocase SecA2, partial [Eubacterium sp.]|nr:accessory Sec system translocase SecA2 [Eubacterium sp.]
VLGFDYLLNNLIKSADERFMREFNYIIIDEADSVLLDSAQTPLVISGSPRVQSNLYRMADFFVSTLKKDVDFMTEEKKVWLTAKGVEKAEYFFDIRNFYDDKYFEINRHVILALRAHVLFLKQKEYVVDDNGEIVLLDRDTGRAMPGVKIRGGQHQAIEMKEKIKLTQENRSVASITYQNLFRLFPKMSGMSGTISDAADEILDIYNTEIIIIPPNHKVNRHDKPDIFFKDATSQIREAIKATCLIHESGQPVLVVASTIAETEVVSRLLVEKNIPHNTLNANNVFWEAQIIKEAGQKDAVTVATSIVGRGTDIKLGEGVKELGGLAVIGIGRMANIRQERQARGRSGRQGDPGYSRFFVCLEDDVVETYGPKAVGKIVADKKGKIKSFKIKRMINTAQKIGEEYAAMGRKKAMEYDRVIQKQREIMYDLRNHLLDGGSLSEEKLDKILLYDIDRFIKTEKPKDIKTVERYILDNLSYSLPKGMKKWKLSDKKQLKKELANTARASLKNMKKKLEWKNDIEDFIRLATLSAIDDAWVEQVDYLQQLQAAVSGRASAQRDLVFEFQKEAHLSFEDMEISIKKNIIRNVCLSSAEIDEDGKMRLILP